LQAGDVALHTARENIRPEVPIDRPARLDLIEARSGGFILAESGYAEWEQLDA
jgi:hypothetical protein